MTSWWSAAVLALPLMGCGAQDYMVGDSNASSGLAETTDDDLVDPSCTPACNPSEICVSGGCVCRLGFERCGDLCVDLDSDPAHCGQCDQVCNNEVCSDGNCSGSCAYTMCGVMCAELHENPFNCGACGNACASNERCDDGECQGYTVPNCAVCPCEFCGACNPCREGELESHPVVCLVGKDCP